MKRAVRPWIGISGYDYKPWRGGFYPPALPARQWWATRARRRCGTRSTGWGDAHTCGA